MTKVTVYIPTYNYGRYIERAVNSVFKQTMNDWELIIIDDGSTDNTREIISQYMDDSYADSVRVVQQENKGLTVSNNIALRLANGEYIMRLDADDYLDENILMVLSNILDSKPDVGLVYPDYYLVNEEGDIIESVRRKKIDEEVELLDLPAHGACTMFRTGFLEELGGYTEDIDCQDGYDIWLRMIQKYRPYNVNIPLFYYRQHPVSLTKNHNKILSARRHIKSEIAKKISGKTDARVLGIVPVIGTAICHEMEPFTDVNGKPLIWHTLNEIQQTRSLDKIIVSSEDDRVLEYVSEFSKVTPLKRPIEYAKSTTRMVDLVNYLIKELKESDGYEPDLVCLLYMNTPLRRACHIEKAVNTMKIFDVDSVISIEEELAPCYHHERFGLMPINETQNNIRLERKSIFKENGAVYLTKVSVLTEGKILGKRVAHITMLPEESIKIKSSYDLWLAKKILGEWRPRQHMASHYIMKKTLDPENKDLIGKAKLRSEKEFSLTPGNNIDLICDKLTQLKDVNGAYVECGVFQGNTFFTVADYLQSTQQNRKAYGLDTFEGFPDSEIDEHDHPRMFVKLYSEGKITEEHFQEAQERTDNFASVDHLTQDYFSNVNSVFEIAAGFSNVELVKGPFVDSLVNINEPIALLFLDCDLYQSYLDCLNTLYQKVVHGGVVIFDEYYSLKYPGARIAVNEFFEDKLGHFEQYHTDEGFERWCFVKG